ncbi:hypothetical protein RIF29_24366 [Crotalaria pallida]|uniref:Ribosome-recycling factor, chloroplastic n=1 Tax=Crotalaria pallida TaxID=3830 RepID=A0AAN9EPS5_CROPI
MYSSLSWLIHTNIRNNIYNVYSYIAFNGFVVKELTLYASYFSTHVSEEETIQILRTSHRNFTYSMFGFALYSLQTRKQQREEAAASTCIYMVPNMEGFFVRDPFKFKVEHGVWLEPSKSKNSNFLCERGRRLMSAYVRRAFSCRTFFLLRSSVLHDYNSSLITRTPINNSMIDSSWVFNVPASNFVVESRRAFAKGRKSKDEAGVSTIEVPPDVLPNIKANAVSLMESAIGALSGELSKLRTGRASPGMLDHIVVEISGVKTHMNRVAIVSVIDQKTLSVNPYDPQTLKQLEDAIVSSPLGLNPKVDGDRLIAVIPPLTKEHIQAMSKLVTKACEESRLSIRRARQKAMDAIKKLYSNLPKDDIKRFEKEVDDLTKRFIKNAEDVCKAKEKEISQALIMEGI